MKAEGEEEAVLCSGSHTFALKTTDVSDALYLLPPATAVSRGTAVS